MPCPEAVTISDTYGNVKTSQGDAKTSRTGISFALIFFLHTPPKLCTRAKSKFGPLGSGTQPIIQNLRHVGNEEKGAAEKKRKEGERECNNDDGACTGVKCQRQVFVAEPTRQRNSEICHGHSFKFLLEVGQVSLPVLLRHCLGCLLRWQYGISA